MFSGRSTMAVCKAGGLVNRVRVPAPRLSVKFICRQVPPARLNEMNKFYGRSLLALLLFKWKIFTF